jgi:chromosome segregation ATPase
MSQVAIYNQIDRFVTSSTPSDALLALSAITDSIRFIRIVTNSSKTENNQNENEEERRRIFGLQSILAQHEDFIKAICSLLSDKTLPGIRNVIVDGGDTAACEFLLSFLSSLDIEQEDDKASRERLKFETNAQLKKLLSGGTLTHAVLDLLSHPTFADGDNTVTTSLYAKTSAIQILSKMTVANPTLLHSQILNAPDGLPRVIDLLKPASLDEESIRNEALLLCTIMAKTSPGSARLMIFGEAYDKVFDIATDDNVDSAVKGDCLKLCIEMTVQDEMGSEVFLGNGRLVRDLSKFLDLRFGMNFVRPEAELHDESDDLDDILNGGTGDKGNSLKGAKVPFLTKDEEEIMLLALELFRVLVVGDMDYEDKSSDVAKRRKRQKAMLSHDLLCRLLIDMALYTLPPPDSPHSVYVSAVPTLQVQLLALDVMAALSRNAGEELQDLILSKRGIYLNVGVLDRLMYLICTGDGANRLSETTGGADEISIHSLGVLRCLLNAKESSLMMMHTIAPPPPEDDNSMNVTMEVPEVQKLVNTLGENLHILSNEGFRSGLDIENKKRISRMIIGSAGALGIFLTNGAEGTTREMLLRVPIPPPPSPDGLTGMENVNSDSHPSLIECSMRFIEICSNDKEMLLEFRNVVSALLRILCEWAPSTPDVISTVLTSASSISLGVLLQLKPTQNDPPLIPSLAGLLLGLCMENMDPGDELGGWSISSIMNLINVGLGIGKFTQLLESTKTYFMHPSDKGESAGPWGCSDVERTHFFEWYKTNVNIVRKKAIQELTLSGDHDSESDSDSVDQNDVTSRDIRALRKLVLQQTSEIQALKEKLHQTEESVIVKSAEIRVLNKRLESNPSQLDDLLNESTAKLSELEIQNRALTSKITFKERDFKEMLRLKDEAIAETRDELKRAKEETRVALEDKASLKEKLSGLSVAYSNLEEEYNKLSSNTSQPTGADSSEGVMPISSYQIVKDNNAKLKNDVRAANDWMKKAVKKMEDLNRRNAELENKVKLHESQIRSEVSSTSLESTKSILANYELQLDEMARERDLLKKEVEILMSKLTVAESRIQRDEVGHDTMTSLASKVKSLENAIMANTKQYSGTISGLEQGLASKDQIISDLEKEINELREKLDKAQLNFSGAGTEDSKKLQHEIEKLLMANKSAQEWMTNAVKHHKSLKQQVQDLKEENLRLSSEVSQRNAYDTDMSTLQKQVQDAVVERDMVRSQLVHLESKLVELQNAKEEESSLKSKELFELNDQLQSRQKELDELKTTLDTKEAEFFKERTIFASEKENLLESLRRTENELHEVKNELEGTKIAVETSVSEYDERSEAFCKLTVEVQMLKEENSVLLTERDDHLVAIEDMKNRLTEFHSWTETAQQRITELESEKDLADVKIKELQEQVNQRSRDQDSNHVDDSSELDAAKQRLIEVEADLISASDKIRDLENEVHSLSNKYNLAQKELDEKSKMDNYASLQELTESKNVISQLEHERNEALGRSSDAFAQLSVLEIMKDELNAKLEALEQERLSDNAAKEELQKQLDSAKSELESMRDTVYQWEATYEFTKSELSSVQLRVEELNNEKKSQNELLDEVKQKYQEELNMLQEDISRLRMQIGDLDGRNRALIEENKDLEEVNNELNSKLELLDEVEENLFEKENEVADLNAALDKEKKSLLDLQHETDKVIEQWTGTFMIIDWFVHFNVFVANRFLFS